MPIHDWTRADACEFHNFHRGWSVELSRAMNRGLLPAGYSALLERTGHPAPTPDESDDASYARRTDRVRVCSGLGPSLAVVEIASPGHTATADAVRQFAATATEFIRAGVNYLLVGLFPPTAHAPDGLFRFIWDELDRPPLNRPVSDKAFTIASFDASDGPTVYLEFAAIGDVLPAAPLFLDAGRCVNVSLEQAYRAEWNETLPSIRDAVKA